MLIVLFWYENLIMAGTGQSRLVRQVRSPISFIFFICVNFLKSLIFLLPCVINATVRFSLWRSYGYITTFTELYSVLKPLVASVAAVSWIFPRLCSFTLDVATNTLIVTVSVILFLDYCFAWLLYLLSLVLLFFRLALLPINVTWVFVSFWYKIALNLELHPQNSTTQPLVQRLEYLVNLLYDRISTYWVTAQVRVLWWNLLIQRFMDSFFFLKRFYRINDLMWQDGFLFDFLQKKVIDRWVRTFVIYSGYLFSERLWFDYVVRFYIDLIIWPGHSKTIYEFTSISATLVTILSLLLFFFYLSTLYYFYTSLF
jgi:hypothetical protein